jgi:hypothetical protein
MKIKFTLAIFLVMVFCSNVKAQDSTGNSIYFDIPVFDFPYQSLAARTAANHRNSLGAENNSNANFGDFIKTYTNPSMNQILNWSASWLTLVGHGVNKGSNALIKRDTRFKKIVNQTIRELTFTGSNVFLIYYPLADGWVHEEFHRATMTTSKVYSYDNINSFNALGQEHISVTQERDEDLSYFKKNDPTGFNRMLVAGGEGELLLSRKLVLNNFYYNSNMPVTLYNLLIKYLVISYVNKDATLGQTEELTERELKETKISDRDFTGPDYSGWIWHLFKSDLPYDSLGIHPTGVGIDRYKSAEDLTSEEVNYLEKVGKVMMLNYISPMTFGVNRISLGKNRYGNFAIQTFLNGFGYDINPEIYFKTPKYNLYFGIHSYHNYSKGFWGLEVGVYKNELKVLNKALRYDGRLMLWSQPEHQEFKTENATLGGLIQTKIYFFLSNWLQGYIDIEAKSEGWVAGNPYLKQNVSIRAGCDINIKNSSN